MTIYQAYLLRVWREPEAPEDEWRIVLQGVDSAEKVVLHTLAELAPYVRRQVTDTNPQGDQR